ncbi:hypothetical protein B4086_5578 [Bacillus cereus]|nr:hypothetical protein B4086_5578 [Bacillus cereus]
MLDKYRELSGFNKALLWGFGIFAVVVAIGCVSQMTLG